MYSDWVSSETCTRFPVAGTPSLIARAYPATHQVPSKSRRVPVAPVSPLTAAAAALFLRVLPGRVGGVLSASADLVEAVVEASDPTVMDRLATEGARLEGYPLDVRVAANPGRDRLRFTVRRLGA